jgi:trans-aconitate 2-methyltransferase
MSSSWDADTYARASDAQARWAGAVLDRLALRGDETVLDAGCGAGGVTLRLLERLPRGRVIAVDSSPEMVDLARRTLGDRAEVRLADLAELELELDEPVDAVFSNAVFHWIADHDRLFARLHAALRPGGVLVAQFGGEGNLAGFFSLVDDVSAAQPYAEHLTGFTVPKQFASPAETEDRLRAAGFGPVQAWLEPSEVSPADPVGFIRTAPLRCHLQRLPDELHEPFLADVLARAGYPLRLDFQRLNVQATRPPAFGVPIVGRQTARGGEADRPGA